MGHRRRLRLPLARRLLPVLAGCGMLAAAAQEPPPAAGHSTELRAGPLRVLSLHALEINQPHRDFALERAMLDDFAAAEGRPLLWVQAFRPHELYEKLLRGEGDLIVGSLPPELRSDPSLARSAPLATERYQLIGRSDGAVSSPLELDGKRVGARISSPLWPYLERLRERLPDFTLEALPNDIERDAMLRLVADGRYDATVLPAGGRTRLDDHPRLKPLFDLTGVEAVTWYLRAEDRSLAARLNDFIERFHAAYDQPATALRDFPAIKERGVLRVITRVDPGNYFVKDGRPAGYELELARAFAAQHGLRLEVLVGDTDEELVRWLTHGVGDIVTTRLDALGVRGDPGVRMSLRYHHSAFSLVTPAHRPIPSPAALRGQTIVAYAGSAELRALRSLRRDFPALRIIQVDPALDAATLRARVARGSVDAVAIAGDRVAAFAGADPALAIGASIPHRFHHRWTVRGGDDALLEAIGEFMRKSHRNGLDALLATRYFGRQPAAERPEPTPGISPYDSIVQHYADRYGFDWRLIAALICQESQFDPAAVSRAGATGLTQLMPGTARALGFADLRDPEAAIHAGVHYLHTLRQQFGAEVPASERTWFALAAYNGGRAQLERARRLARRLDLDPNEWFGNVETAMLAMTREGKGAPRSGQAIIYVRAIHSLYETYRSLQLAARAAPAAPPA